MAPQKLSARNVEKLNSTWNCFVTTFLDDRGETPDHMKLEELHAIYDNEFSVAPDFGDNGPSFIFEKLINDLERLEEIKIDENNTLIENSLRRFKRVTIGQYVEEQEKNHIKTKKKACYRNALYCTYCDAFCNQPNFDTHLSGLNHCGQMRFHFQNNNNRKILGEDKHDVKVTSDYDVETDILVKDVTENELVTIDITIKNESENTVTLLLGWLLMNDSTFKLDEPLKHEPIHPDGTFTFPVLCEPESVSNYRNLLALAFALPDKSFFQILRNITVEVESEVTKELKPKSRYVKSRRARKRTKNRNFIEGKPLSYVSSDGLEMTKLKQYNIPEELETMMDTEDTDDIKEMLKETLTSENYADKFSTLLHIEERQMDLDILEYSMKDAKMTPDRNKSYLKLNVPGLAENRPSVLKGDHLFATIGERKKRCYKGYVHRVEMEDLVLGFNSSLVERYIHNSKFKIDFTFNRLPLMIQHRAVSQAISEGLEHVLFPDERTATPLCKRTITFFNPDIENNAEQREAVRHITKGSSRPAPYLVFGPPGTGKTVTIVEAIKQVNKHIRGSTILACAPSNSAADLIAVRLLKSGTKSVIYRMNAKTRGWNTVDEVLKEAKCCNYNSQTGENEFPPKEEIQKYRIVVTTLVTAGRLASANFPQDHFTHVFIDEAGHAEEPEAIIAVSNLLNPNNPKGGQLVLAGDPKQLGPVLRSPLAIKFGLATSLLERLMTDNPLYERKEEEPHYNPKVTTKLLRNYRSHPEILKVPNELFYDNELEAKAKKGMRETMCQWEALPKENFPLIFHGVEGKDEREGNSPSFFNTKECHAVLTYIKQLMEEKYSRKKVKQTDIGVISPYRKQVQKIQEALEKRNYKEIKVGSVEEFQGQERLIIIVSTVRSDNEYSLEEDKKYKLGFLDNPKRFNVAITRAKALLIVIGNPVVLSRDENWNSLIDFCNKRGGSRGVSGNDKLRNIRSKFTESDLEDENNTGVSLVAQYNDPAWCGGQ